MGGQIPLCEMSHLLLRWRACKSFVYQGMNLILNFVDWLGSMILIACVILAVFPAGILFPQIGGREVLHVHERQRNGQGQKGGNGEGANG